MGQVVELRNPVLEMVKELEGLKDAEAEIKARRRAITEELEKTARFKGQTGYVDAPGYKVTITKPRRAEWDQAKLRDARKAIGDDTFKLYFDYEFVAGIILAIIGIVMIGEVLQIYVKRVFR